MRGELLRGVGRGCHHGRRFVLCDAAVWRNLVRRNREECTVSWCMSDDILRQVVITCALGSWFWILVEPLVLERLLSSKSGVRVISKKLAKEIMTLGRTNA